MIFGQGMICVTLGVSSTISLRVAVPSPEEKREVFPRGEGTAIVQYDRLRFKIYRHAGDSRVSF